MRRNVYLTENTGLYVQLESAFQTNVSHHKEAAAASKVCCVSCYFTISKRDGDQQGLM